MTSPGAVRRVWWVLVGGVRILGRIARSLIAAAVLLALVVGLPWALWHYIGWPLPDLVPTWDEVQIMLLSPMTPTFLLDVLACLCWITWAAFSIDVLRCATDLARDGIDAARSSDWSASGPVHALAGALVGAVLVSVLGNRLTPAPAASSSAALVSGSQVVATAPAWHTPAHDAEAEILRATFTSYAPDTERVPSGRAYPESVVVLAPHDGVHDSLWRIAQRTLGDGARWPEIFELNKGKPQPDGRPFTQPSLIFPGEELALPSEAPVQPTPPQLPPTTPTPPTTPPPSLAPASPHLTGTNTAPQVPREPGFMWGPELFVGSGLVAAVSAALMAARRHYRSRYRPGSGDRDDLPVAPVVYQLRLAHLREQDNDSDFDEDGEDTARPRRGPAPPAVVVGDCADNPDKWPALVAGLGVRDGREIALNLAIARGLGLVGPGAPAALRALLLTALTTSMGHPTGTPRPRETTVVVQGDDLAGVLGHRAAHAHLPTALRVATSLHHALDALEAEILVRATAAQEQASRTESWPVLVLVAEPTEQQRQRLQAVLDNGAPFGVTGLLLGQWQPGVTAYVRNDGTISATGPGLGEVLRGTRMFRLGDDDATEILTLLRQADPDAAAHAPGGTEPVAEIDLVAAGGDSGLEILGAEEITEPSGDQLPAAPIDHLSQTPREQRSIVLTVFGSPAVHYRRSGSEVQEITGAIGPRMRELLIFLALHPAGISREALVGALWRNNTQRRPTNALNTTLSRLRRTLSAATGAASGDIVVNGDGRYRLDADMVQVDYWRFANAVTARRAAVDDRARVAAYREIVDSYGGQLAEGIGAEWLEPVREATRRDAVDAVAALARALVDTDPQQTLDLLEIARAFDPHNERVYRDIMRLQHKLGHRDAVPRTLALLTTRLAEIDARPDAQTRELAARLRDSAEPGGDRCDQTPVA
ncbi:BTAD domain-containing putative transcriptional regulator [Lentzea sp. E54]|uniref:BTAD domain-containing putative transcriptional regulator n=1 Tax=Lentzea xerophila TaxID=3435883 RepID=UPI003DA66CD7